jgi:hypothetical protein
MCTWRSGLGVAGVLLLGMMGSKPVHAIPPFWEGFQAKYVKQDATEDKAKEFAKIAAATKCNVCHIKGEKKSERNPYGAALAKLLNKDNFKKERLEKEGEQAKKEIQDALEKVAGQKVDPDKDDSPTFDALIAEGKLPGEAIAEKPAEPAEEQAPAEEKPEEAPAESTEAADSSAAAPAGAGLLAAQLISQIKDELKNELRAELEPRIREQLRAELRARIKADVKGPLKESIKAVMLAEMNAPGEIDAETEKAAVEVIEALGGSVMPLAQNDDSKTIAFHLSGKELTDDGVSHLLQVNKLVHLNLKDTQITNAALEQVGRIITLTRLNLARTQVSDEGLRHLRGLDNITYLNLYGTQVTDAGLEHLKGMTNLRKLYLWQSKVTEAGAKQLQEELPDCEVNY